VTVPRRAPAIAVSLALTLAAAMVLATGLTVANSGVARAQGPPYAAEPPTYGALYRDGQTDKYLLGGEWLYRADRGDVGIAQGWWQNVAATDGWSPVTIPNAYNAGDFSTASMNGYVGWYRRDFVLPSGAFPNAVPAQYRKWIIRFESVNYTATVWLNGHQIGTHEGAYLPFEFDLTDLRPGVNRLIVRVDHRRNREDLPQGPSGGWWNFGGLLREVYLRAAARADISNVMVRPLLPCPTCPATVQEQALIRNVTTAPQTVTLAGSYGGARVNFGRATIAPHSSWTAAAAVRINHPRLWSIDNPQLYRASLTLSDARGVHLGGYVTYSGIRSITVVHGRLELNGRLLNLRGAAFHEQDVVEGAALDSAHLQRLMSWEREIGAHVIRAHYPLNPQIFEMADRYGILIWSEIPVWRVDSPHLADPVVLAKAHAMLTSNILTNQNHPSVMLWSVANELTTPADPPEGAYLAGAAALAHKLDPTRPVGMAISDWPGVGCQRAYRPLDVLGFNDYFGWFDAGGGATADRDALGPFLDEFRACYPSKALFITEFGFDGNRHGPVEERGTYEYQSNAAQYHLGVFATKHWLSGAIWWTLQDFANSPGATGGNPRGDPPFIQKGLFDLQGNPRPVLSVVSSIFHATVQITPVPRR
jgi:beta-glucuronidase